MANYNLPGVYTFYKERGLLAPPSVTEDVTDIILLIGTAHDGPKNTPVRVERPQDAIAIFGHPGRLDGKNGGALLVPAFIEAYYAGARNIYLMRVTGKEAKLEIPGVMTLTAPNPGSKYNNLMLSIEVDDIDPENPEKKIFIWNKAVLGVETSAGLADINPDKYEVFEVKKFKSLGDLARAIADRAGLIVELADDATLDGIEEFTDKAFAGGADEILGEDIQLGNYTSTDETGSIVEGAGYRAALEQAYELIVDYDVSIIVPLGVYVDFKAEEEDTVVYDRTDADVLANFCYTAARRNNDVVGMISVRPFKGVSLAEVKEEVDLLVEATNNEYVAEDGVDIGKYLSIVVGEGIFSDRELGTYNNTLASAYAGLVSTLPIQSGSTNKIINGVTSLRYNLSPAQASALREKKFTVIRNKFNRGITVVEGVISSLPTSDFQSLSTVRVVHGVMDAIRGVVDPFIGEPLDIPHVTALENAISGTLDRLTKEGVLSSANFQILFPQNAAIMGDVTVMLELGIASELRRILVTVSRSIPQLER